MGLTKNFKKLGQDLLDLIFPISCLICGADQTFLCAQCQAQLPRLDQQQCIGCQKPSPFGKTHPDCISKNTADGALAAAPYRDPNVAKIIETFKYNFVFELARPLADLIVETVNRQGLDEYFGEFTIIPVPLHPRRYNWRGFNQAELLIAALAEKLQIPCDLKLVVRGKFTKPQIKLSAEERKKNLDNAFSIIGDPINKKILIVDDVVTSGSTVNELAKILKRAGASEVWALSAAHG
ncbi:MAG: hypothetical protein A3J07_01960 [Candidatus Doudnabacteria bacterium RIFCSPLOWO2_02_FULL_49_13]|uniref:Phosphoribosyltransferase domain-containing protein n=1 Tax=Candidatus Doudnabacteria bacterium RIFCSPHIGHO2_12_FULL_48_16 TaxID=1817838 RepID=A0A1F5PLB5_9BACT|nr:MAG: hypothetical protein A3B77_00750 [Candidatus Doudnabacteria bacterium RIFCSPHIGHO2_02_FULL_49_24]OGE88777.1 MAG: hypothetical protein A2760_01105 [Candidatus Doudnabacteria bacterium RIFCSPHIGHO2_01_FULL_50_67]OGE90701.1 MAG: hypothetical protein A3E29_01055 [Candidatus Doudnabacteria bacterium RIFCSPHIGHO2_12_FULL_48_16]OGE97768.1 MAG: hypothetical protein A2990_03665 [Candidatus Doudnabacteria bacterium RIFCSPLOWO2_01_FULL_49_40]OGF02565.1 MAG: hypothetical protein A3J07_01960 [Candid